MTTDKDESVFYNGKWMTRDWADAIERWQGETHYFLDGQSYARIRYGSETFILRIREYAQHHLCRHCDAKEGQLHDPLCDWEQCPRCQYQRMTCDCNFEGYESDSSFWEDWSVDE